MDIFRIKNTNGLRRYMVEDIHSDSFLGGFSWYKEANAFACELADMSGLPIEIVCGVIAVLSPAVSWEVNKADAVSMILAEDVRSVRVSTYGQNRHKAIDLIVNGNLSAIGGRKVTSFYRNILNPECPEAVTIDRHAVRACLGKRGLKYSSDNIPTLSSHKRYKYFSLFYERLAKKYNLIPNQVQAIVWCEFRRKLNLT